MYPPPKETRLTKQNAKPLQETPPALQEESINTGEVEEQTTAGPNQKHSRQEETRNQD